MEITAREFDSFYITMRQILRRQQKQVGDKASPS